MHFFPQHFISPSISSRIITLDLVKCSITVIPSLVIKIEVFTNGQIITFILSEANLLNIFVKHFQICERQNREPFSQHFLSPGINGRIITLDLVKCPTTVIPPLVIKIEVLTNGQIIPFILSKVDLLNIFIKHFHMSKRWNYAPFPQTFSLSSHQRQKYNP